MIDQIRYSEATYAAPTRWNLEQLLRHVDADHVFVVSLRWADPGDSPGVATVITDSRERAATLATAYAMERSGKPLPIHTEVWSPIYNDPARWPPGRPLAPDEK